MGRGEPKVESSGLPGVNGLGGWFEESRPLAFGLCVADVADV